MMRFVSAFQSTQDGDRVFYCRLIDIDSHEPARQGGVAFNIFAILIERRGA